MKQFAKILEVDGYQILVYIDTDTEKDQSQLHQIIGVNGGTVHVTISYAVELPAEDLLAFRDEAWARKFLNSDMVKASIEMLEDVQSI